MNLAKIRADLKVVAETCGVNAWDYAPDDVKVLPAAVVGAPQAMRRLNRLKTEVEIPVAFYVNNADPQDATRRMDALLSMNVQNDPEFVGVAFMDVLDTVHAEDGPAWDSVRFSHAEPYSLVNMGNDAVALACKITLTLTA